MRISTDLFEQQKRTSMEIEKARLCVETSINHNKERLGLSTTTSKLLLNSAAILKTFQCS